MPIEEADSMTATLAASRTRIALLLALAGAAWLVASARMSGMDMGPGTELGSLGWFAVTWVVMMAAMMLPALGPAVVRQRGSSALFVAGYLVPWAAPGVVGYAVVEGARAGSGRYLAAVVILGAAAYQFTGVKNTALRRCRGAGGPITGIE